MLHNTVCALVQYTFISLVIPQVTIVLVERLQFIRFVSATSVVLKKPLTKSYWTVSVHRGCIYLKRKYKYFRLHVNTFMPLLNVRKRTENKDFFL